MAEKVSSPCRGPIAQVHKGRTMIRQLWFLVINIMAAERKQQESPHRKQLQLIADLAHYQPVPSIPAPSLGFNYTLSQQRYSQFQTPRAVRKQKAASWGRSDDFKLSTILETQHYNHLFPRVNRPKDSPKKKVKHLPTLFHKERQETEATRERSITHDTPRTIQEQHFFSMESQRDNEQSLSLSRKQPIISHKNIQSRVPLLGASFAQAESEEQQEDEYEREAVPGPGSYSYSYSDFDKSSLGKKSTMATFISQSSRFPQLKPKFDPNPKIVSTLQAQREQKRDEFIKARKSRRKLVPFNSKSPRQLNEDSPSKLWGPGPEDYSPRFGIEEDLIKKIQRNFKANFGSGQQRFKPNKESRISLGPGCYQLPPTNSIPLSEGPNFYFKSRQQRFSGV